MVVDFASLNWKPNLELACIWVGYIALMFALRILVPGKQVMGEPLPPDYKRRLPYTINGFRIVLMFLSGLVFLWKIGCINPRYIMRNIPALFVIANIWAFLGIFIHFFWGLRNPEHERHGNLLLDLWFGIDLNPRLFGVDLKVFAYLPSMFLWLVFNLFALLAHYEKFGTVHTGMLLYQIFTGIYVLDYFWFEEAILSIYDVIEERFGFMLIWGDYVWISFVFPLNAYIFLVNDNRTMHPVAVVALCALFIVGFTIFRGANLQKATIKKDRNALVWGRPPQYVDGKLLVSGWWGVARKINYTGDLLLAYSFALTCGFNTWITWVYPAYLTILLLQRCFRDERRCSRKYGATWEKYVKAVPYRMIPGLY